MNIKKLSLLLLFFVVLSLIPLSVYANRDRDSYELNISGNEFIVGEEVAMNKEVADSIYAVGGTVTVENAVSQDVYVAGGNIGINGTVNDDVFIAGGNILIDGTINGDLYVAGGNVVLDNSSLVNGKVWFVGGRFFANGTINGDVTLRGKEGTFSGQLKGDVNAQFQTYDISPEAHFYKNFTYKGPQYVEGLNVDGEVLYLGSIEDKDIDLGAFFGSLIIWSIFSQLLIGILLLAFFPHLFISLGKKIRKSFFKNVGVGFVSMLLVMIAAIILLMTVIGIPLAILLFMWYGVLGFIASNAIPIMCMSFWKEKYMDNFWKKTAILLLHILIISIIGLVPFIGPLFILFLWFAALGGMLGFANKMRKQK